MESNSADREYDPGVPPDSFWQEGRQPARPPARQRASEPAGRTMPHSLEAEEYLLACCLLDGAEVVGQCIRSRITAASFYDNKHRLVFEGVLELYRRNARVLDVSVLAEEMKTRGQLDEVGGYSFLAQVSSRIPTTAQASFFIETVKNYAVRREAIRAANRIIEESHDLNTGIEEFTQGISSKIAAVADGARKGAAIEAVPILSFKYPHGQDPGILLGSDDYLGRGGGMLFVSHAGAGKSSFIMDACMSWAIGEPWMGIKCNGPLRALIIQAEDSDRYIGKVAESFVFARELGDDLRNQVNRGVIVARVRGITGEAFLAEVERLVDAHRPDIAVINPIYLYAEGDIARAEFAQPFLLGLDRINREQRFGWILVHHSGKPAQKDAKGKRAEVDDWETTYMGFGSSYFANWPRCSILLEPRPNDSKRYWLKLGKGGPNAGVMRKIPIQDGMSFRLEPTTRIAIKQSGKMMPVGGIDRKVIFWELDEDQSEATASGSEPAGRKNPGPPCKFGTFYQVFEKHCPTYELRKPNGQLYKAALAIDTGLKKSTFTTMLTKAVDDGFLVRTAEGYHLPGKP